MRTRWAVAPGGRVQHRWERTLLMFTVVPVVAMVNACATKAVRPSARSLRHDLTKPRCKRCLKVKP